MYRRHMTIAKVIYKVIEIYRIIEGITVNKKNKKR